MLLLALVLIASLAELCLTKVSQQNSRQPISLTLVLIWTAVSVYGLLRYSNLGSIILASLIVYKIVNIGRLETGSAALEYRIRRFKRCSLYLSLATAVIAGLIWLWPSLGITWSEASNSWAALSLLAATATLIVTYLNQRHYRGKSATDSLQKLPTVSVLIPARSETDQLTACLSSVVTSDYPKLEVIVLDDCSPTRKTPDIIRSFAAQGIRFLAGQAPPPDWLAKNYALEQLAQQANGDWLLFCGADVSFSKDTIKLLLDSALGQDLDMACWLPVNQFKQTVLSYLLQPLRYSWEIMLPRQLLKRPPVLSTCWLIRRDSLLKLGGFKEVRHKIAPESYFAQSLARYQFQITERQTGLLSSKTSEQQQETATRKRYPQLHRRIELAAGLSLLEGLLGLGPIWLLLVGLTSGRLSLIVVSASALAVNLASYGIVVCLTYRRLLPLAFLSQPVALIYDLYSINHSLYKYEFSEVVWKGRNTSLPLMQVGAERPQSGPPS